MVLRWVFLGVGAHALTANPIRKVVNLLQNLRQEVDTEGERDKKAFDKALCFCKSNDAQTSTEIEEATMRGSSLEASIKELAGSNAQLKSEIKELEEEIAEDTKSVDEATAVRNEEAGQYASESMELKTNIAALDTAIPALKKGISGSFLQTLKPALARAANTAPAGDRAQILELLQGKVSAGSSDQILGILENMRDTFKDNLAKSTKEEEDAINTYNQLMGGKTAELKAAKSEAEEKKGRVAAQVQKKADAEEDLEDTRENLATATNYLVNLRKSCNDKKAEFERTEKLRQEEVNAIQDTIKILNDDDSLDTFKKTLPSPAFVQIRAHKQFSKPAVFTQTGTLGKFDKLSRMVQDMVVILQNDQTQDDKHLKWCRSETELTQDQLAAVKANVSAFDQKLEQVANEAKTALDAINVLKTDIAAVDVAVAQATQQRKEEQELYVQEQSELNLASTLLQKASERLSKQYAEPLEPAPKAESLAQTSTSENETAEMLGLSFVQTQQEAPRTGKGLGIVAMIDKLRNDIGAQQTEKTRDNEEQQKDYETFMADTKEARETKQKEVTNKSAARGRLEEVLIIVKKKKTETLEEQTAIASKITALHANCDFIMQNHEARQQARDNEVEGLKKSLAVLAGADYGQAPAPTAFLQTRLK